MWRCMRLPTFPFRRVKLRPLHRPFTVLALESSADDTCAAVVTSERCVLSNVVLKQHVDHEEYGGIHPAVAYMSHQRRMPQAVRQALDIAGTSMKEIDGIAYTRGPGMPGCLSVCANAAKTLGSSLNIPVVGVHHMQAHALTPQLTSPEPPQFPFLTLLVSGGHTMILVARSAYSFEILASSEDSSIGNAFDHISKELKIPWNIPKSLGAGPMLERTAALYSPPPHTKIMTSPASAVPDDSGPLSVLSKPPRFPIPMPHQLRLSYGGLITSVMRYIEKTGAPAFSDDIANGGQRPAIAYAFQIAAVGQLLDKVGLALTVCQKKGLAIKELVVSGGVASNLYLRQTLEEFVRERGVSVQYPPIEFCTDNAAMIAWASIDRFLQSDYDPYEIDSHPKWSLEDIRDLDPRSRESQVDSSIMGLRPVVVPMHSLA